MPESSDHPPKSNNKKRDFKYSQNREDGLEETLTKISRSVYVSAEQKAKAFSNKEHIEVSETHFNDAIDFVLKTGTRHRFYWTFRVVTTLAYAIGLIFVKEGLGDFSFKQESFTVSHILTGVLILVLISIIDVVIVNKK